MEGSRVSSDFRMGKSSLLKHMGTELSWWWELMSKGHVGGKSEAGLRNYETGRERGRQGTQAMVKCCGPVLCVHGSHTRV